jgi:hypothetical protein
VTVSLRNTPRVSFIGFGEAGQAIAAGLREDGIEGIAAWDVLLPTSEGETLRAAGKGMGVRLARLARWDRPRARRLLREAVIEQGVRPVLDDVRRGYEFGAITVATRTLATVLGVAVGTVRAWTSVRARGLTK